MSEPRPGSAGTPFDARSPGELLRKAREKQGMHIAALAAALKVSPRKLEALEADRFDELPDLTFTRALAQSVCRALRIDARPVLELLPAARVDEIEPASNLGKPTRFREPAGSRGEGLAAAASPLFRPMRVGALVLGVAAVALYLAPLERWWGPPPATTPAPAAVALPPVPSTAASAVVPVQPDAPAQAASGAAAAVASAGSAPAVETVFSAPSAAAASDAAGAAGVVQVRCSESTWIEARDGRGQVLLFRTVQAGETLGLDGALPIRLVIGNAAATQVAFRGQPVDLAARTRDNVARLELP